MILFTLRCSKDHEFDGWFKDGASYEAQAAARKIECPVCGDRKVGKAIMAPRLGRSASDGDRPAGPPAEMRGKYMSMLREMRRQVEANCDYVGPSFAEEARKIHEGEVEQRNIYGEATDDEAKSLDEDGVPFNRIPWVPREDA